MTQPHPPEPRPPEPYPQESRLPEGIRQTFADRECFRGRSLRSVSRILFILGLSLCGVACESSRTSFANENDLLREAKVTLEKQVATLERNVESQRAQIEVLRKRLSDQSDLSGSSPAEIPYVTSIEFDRYSGPVDTNGDRVPDMLRIYLRPLDQRGRFLVCVAEAVVQAVIIEPNREPDLLAERVYEPMKFDRAYREGLTGTHYTLEIPLPVPLPTYLKEVTVKVTITDIATGVTLSHQTPIKITNPQ